MYRFTGLILILTLTITGVLSDECLTFENDQVASGYLHNLLQNPEFNNNLLGWKQVRSDMDNVEGAIPLQSNVRSIGRVLELSVLGGYNNVMQTVPVPHGYLEFTGEMNAVSLGMESRHQYDSRIAVFLLLKDDQGKILQVVNAYISPNIREIQKPGKISIKLNPGTGQYAARWIPVKINLADIHRDFLFEFPLGSVKHVGIAASVYGSNRMGIQTVGQFRNFTLSPLSREELSLQQKQSLEIQIPEEPGSGIPFNEGITRKSLESRLRQVPSGTEYMEHVYIDANCKPVDRTFIIKKLTTAFGFQILDFQRGFKCGKDGIPKMVEFSILNGNSEVYRYQLWEDGRFEESIPIKDLILDSGQYALKLKGGPGTSIVIRYFLRTRPS